MNDRLLKGCSQYYVFDMQGRYICSEGVKHTDEPSMGIEIYEGNIWVAEKFKSVLDNIFGTIPRE